MLCASASAMPLEQLHCPSKPCPQHTSSPVRFGANPAWPAQEPPGSAPSPPMAPTAHVHEREAAMDDTPSPFPLPCVLGCECCSSSDPSKPFGAAVAAALPRVDPLGCGSSPLGAGASALLVASASSAFSGPIEGCSGRRFPMHPRTRKPTARVRTRFAEQRSNAGKPPLLLRLWLGLGRLPIGRRRILLAALRRSHAWRGHVRCRRRLDGSKAANIRVLLRRPNVGPCPWAATRGARADAFGLCVSRVSARERGRLGRSGCGGRRSCSLRVRRVKVSRLARFARTAVFFG